MTIHALQQEADQRLQEDLKKKGIEILTRISKGIRERKAWATIREEQVSELEASREELFKAYDAVDEHAFKKVSEKVHEILNRGCKSKNDKSFQEDPFE